MKSSSIAILAAGALGLAAVAGLVISKRGDKPEPTALKLFPNLSAKVNDAARVEILRGGQQTVLVKSADGAWSVESRGGYPAEFENVKTLIVGLSKSEIVEEKTSNPESYSRIGVEEPKAAVPKPAEAAAGDAPTPESQGSTLVTLKDSGGQTLASVILGNTPAASGFSPEQAKFARRAGEKPSYLIKPAPAAEAGVMSWVSREVMKIDGVRIQSVRVHNAKPLESAPPSGDPNAEQPSTLAAPALPQDVVIERSAPTAQDALGKLEFKNMPPGRELKTPGQDGQIATAIAYLDMEDVTLAGAVSEVPVLTTAEFRTKDGLSVVVTTREKDGKTWGTIQASAFAVLPPPKAEEKPTEKPDAAKEGEKKDDAKPAEATAGPAVPIVDSKIDDEAKKLNEKLGKWAFAIPSWKAGLFKSNWKELLKEPTPPAAAPGPIAPELPAAPAGTPPG